MNAKSNGIVVRLSILSFFLSGCMVQVSADEIEISQKVCEPHGGISLISYDYKAWCKDGALIEYRKLLK